jgi:glucan biosynthesis protein C
MPSVADPVLWKTGIDAMMPRAESAPQVGGRLHAIDWLRVLSALAVFFAHVAHIFDFDLEGSVKNRETSLGASVYMFFVFQWLMPLFFLLAGVSTWFSLRSRSAKTYLHERVQRLLIPLLFGTLVLIPWNGYMSALNRGIFDGSYWSYLPVHVERTSEALMRPEVHHGLVALYHTSWHLWFLGYLLIFSALALLWTRRAPEVSGLAALCEWRFGLLTLGLPIALVKLALAAGFPAYLDWSDTLVFLTAFSYGWLFMTDDRFFRAVERQALSWLAVGSVCFAMILGTYAIGYLPEWIAHPAYTADYLLYQLLAALNTWAWLLAITGCGLRWLNFGNPALQYAGEAALPFYILHQVVVLSVAAAVVEWPAGVATKVIAIGSMAFGVTMLIYELLVRRIRLLRMLFGLKAAPPAARAPMPSRWSNPGTKYSEELHEAQHMEGPA